MTTVFDYLVAGLIAVLLLILAGIILFALACSAIYIHSRIPSTPVSIEGKYVYYRDIELTDEGGMLEEIGFVMTLFLAAVISLIIAGYFLVELGILSP